MIEKGLKKPVKLKADLAAFCGVKAHCRVWRSPKNSGTTSRPKSSRRRRPTANRRGSGKFIVADEKLIKLFKNTKVTSKSSGKVTNFTNMQVGQTIDMMQLASVVSANIE